MKKASLAFGLIAVLAVVYTQLCAAPGKPFYKLADASFKWTETTHDFGTIKHNVAVSHRFTFRNNGDVPLIISTVQASCGCTVAEYSKDPIPPGAEGFVKATYNAASLGVFSKTVTVNANTTEGYVSLSIKGVVTE